MMGYCNCQIPQYTDTAMNQCKCGKLKNPGLSILEVDPEIYPIEFRAPSTGNYKVNGILKFFYKGDLIMTLQKVY